MDAAVLLQEIKALQGEGTAATKRAAFPPFLRSLLETLLTVPAVTRVLDEPGLGSVGTALDVLELHLAQAGPAPDPLAADLLRRLLLLACEPRLAPLLGPRARPVARTALVGEPAACWPRPLRAFFLDSLQLLADLAELYPALPSEPTGPVLLVAYPTFFSLFPPAPGPAGPCVPPLGLDVSTQARAASLAAWVAGSLAAVLDAAPHALHDLLARLWALACDLALLPSASLREAAFALLAALLAAGPAPPAVADRVAATLLEHAAQPPHEAQGRARSPEADRLAARCLRLLCLEQLSAASLHALGLDLPRVLAANVAPGATPALQLALLELVTRAARHHADLAAAAPRLLRPFLAQPHARRPVVACLRLAVAASLRPGPDSPVAKRRRGAAAAEGEAQGDECGSPLLGQLLAEAERAPPGGWPALLPVAGSAGADAALARASALACALAVAAPTAPDRVLAPLLARLSAALAPACARPPPLLHASALLSLVDAAVDLLQHPRLPALAPASTAASLPAQLELLAGLSSSAVGASPALWAPRRLALLIALPLAAPDAAAARISQYRALLAQATPGGELPLPAALHAVRRLPLFLARQAQAASPDVHPEPYRLLLDALAALLAAPVPAELALALAACMGRLACVCLGAVAPPAQAVAEPPEDSAAQDAAADAVCCPACDRGEPAEGAAASHPLTAPELWAPLQRPLRAAPSGPDPLCVACVEGLGRVLAHLPGPRLEPAAAPLLALLAHPHLGSVVARAAAPAARSQSALAALQAAADALPEDSQGTRVRVAWLASCGARLAGPALEEAVVRLVTLIFHDDPHAGAAAYDALRQLQRAHRADSLAAFLLRFAPRLAPMLARDPGMLAVSTSLFDCSPADYLRTQRRHIVPRIVAEAAHRSDARQVLEQLARPLLPAEERPEARDLMDQEVLALVLTEPASREEQQAALALLREVTRKELRELLADWRTKLVGALVVQLGDPPRRPQALRALAEVQRRLGPPWAELPLAGFLRGMFFELMMLELNPALLSPATPLPDRLRVLAALEQLVEIMGPHVNAVRPTILTTLKYVLRSSPDIRLRVRALQVFLAFVRRLDVPGALGPLLPQILTDLFGFLDQPETAAPVLAIFRYLVLDQRAALAPYFRDVPFIPALPLPELAPIRQAVAAEGARPLDQELGLLVRGLQNESSNVRKYALLRLGALLAERRGSVLGSLVLAGDAVDEVVARLLERLLAGTRDEDPQCRLLSAETLGELGAIDPGRISQRLALRPDPPREQDEEALAVELVQAHLVPALVAAQKVVAQNRVAFAIQELLRRVLRLSPEPADQLAAHRAWQAFSPEVRELLTPYLSTKYNQTDRPAATAAAGAGDGPVVIYRPTLASYQEWLSRWAAHLAAQLPPDAPALYAACRGVCRYDAGVAHFLLPHLVLQTLRAPAPDRLRDQRVQALLAEALAVLRDAAADTSPAASSLAQGAAQTLFMLIDFLARWLEERRAARQAEAGPVTPTKRSSRGTRTSDAAAAPRPPDPAAEAVERLLAGIPQDALARASLCSRAYPRGLRHLEQALRALQPAAPAEALAEPRFAELLQQIYAGLEDADGLAAAAAAAAAAAQQHRQQQHPASSRGSLVAEAAEHESAGRWPEALACYEQAMGAAWPEPAAVAPLRLGKLQCLQALGQLTTVLDVVHGALAQVKEPRARDALLSHGMQAAWRLGRWDELQSLSAAVRPDAPDFEVCVGRALLALRARDERALRAALDTARGALLEPLAAASLDSYPRCYPLLLRLHLLAEVNMAAQGWVLPGPGPAPAPAPAPGPGGEYSACLDGRLALAQPNYRTQEAILSLRCALLSLRGQEEEAGRAYLQLGKLAKRAAQPHLAAAALAQATAHQVPGAALVRARLQWDAGLQDHAMALLQRELGLARPPGASASAEAGLGLARLQLQAARWMEASGHKRPAEVVRAYEAAVAAAGGEWEKAHFMLGRYYDALLASARGGSRTLMPGVRPAAALEAGKCEHLQSVVQHYGQALRHGHTALFHSLPRMLTLWLDYAAAIADARPGPGAAPGASSSAAHKQLEAALAPANRVMERLASELPAYVWLTALSQLVSRIGHRHERVFEIVRRVLVALLHAHPQQTLWGMQAVLNSGHARSDRQARARQCVDDAVREAGRAPGAAGGEGASRGALERLVDTARQLAEALIDVCNLPVAKSAKHFSLGKDCRRLVRLPLATRVILPLQAALAPLLPPSGRTDPRHAAFGPLATIAQFKDDVEVLGSLARPRKVTVVGSDGRDYLFLCKPKDDLRRDSRLMELNGMINKLLQRAPEARRRQLYVRTYGVVPLNEECGLIEWVPHTQPMRPAILPLYGWPPDGGPELQRQIRAADQPPGGPRGPVFERMLALFRPCRFHRWFLAGWPEPHAWLEARQRYTRTTAVMSMVGATIGLGDRHGENILLDARTGDVVHVDFNCLFWKGKTFEKPERVPFRLTQNMLDAMGLLGHQGPFRAAAEATMSVLRTNRDSLMSVLETFVYDPAVELAAPQRAAGGKDRAGDSETDVAVRTVLEIERTLQGKVQDGGLPVSVLGHVKQLMEEATSADNLAHMYIGWNAWL